MDASETHFLTGNYYRAILSDIMSSPRIGGLYTWAKSALQSIPLKRNEETADYGHCIWLSLTCLIHRQSWAPQNAFYFLQHHVFQHVDYELPSGRVLVKNAHSRSQLYMMKVRFSGLRLNGDTDNGVSQTMLWEKKLI